MACSWPRPPSYETRPSLWPRSSRPCLHAVRQLAVREHAYRRREPAVRLDRDPGRRDSGRDVRPAVDQRRHELDVDLRLDVAAHGPGDDPRAPLALAEQHPGQQGVGRPLARLEDVGVGRVQRERRPTVLEVHARRRVQDPGSETGRVRLDEADGIALGVHDAQPDRAPHQGPSRGRCGVGAGRVDPGSQVRRMLRGEEPLHRDIPEPGIGEEPVAVPEGELRGLELEVWPGGVRPAATREAGTRRRLEPLQDIEDLEGQDAAAVGGVRRDPDAPVRRGDRRGPGAAVLVQVGRGMGAAGHAQPERDPLAEVAVVVGVEAVEGQGAEGRSQRWEPDQLAGPPGASLGSPGGCGTRPSMAPGPGLRLHPLHGLHQPCPRREPGRRVLDRRRQHRIAGEPAPAAVGVGPGADRTRDRDGERTAQRDPVQALRAQCRGVHVPRRAPGAVEGDLLAGRLVPHQPERVAADPAAVGHHHAQHGVGGDRGINGVTARAPARPAPPASRGGGERRPLPGSHARAGRGRAPGQAWSSVATPPTWCSYRRSRLIGRKAIARRISDATKIPSSPAAWAATPPTMLPTIWPRPRNTE